MCPTFHCRFDVLEKQNKASLFDEADRECERLATPEIIFDFIKKGESSIIS